MFNNKKIFILGMARSGYEVAKLLSSLNNEIVINDQKEDQDIEHLKELKDLNIKVHLGNHPDDLFDNTFDVLIKNPGIKDDHKYVVKAKEHKIPVINEVEIAYLLMPKEISLIGITGSNGKTTTTTLIYEMIKTQYNNIHLTGNIGFPLSAFVNNIKPNDIVVMEVSVQQLLNLEKFKTNVSVLLNLSESHLDHVGSYENYKNIKKKIFNNHTNKDVSILNLDDNEVLELTNDIKSNKLYFSKDKPVNCYMKNNNIYINEELLININDIKIKGNHNYENIMAAVLVSKIYNISNDNINKVLKEFNGVEHRIEFVKEINGIKIYNDSKSTNIVATKTALKSFNNPTILLLGGLDRGQSFMELKDYLENVKVVVAYGENKQKIYDEMTLLNKKCIICNVLEEATNIAFNNSKNGDIILLSPGSASWDQFPNFEERGKKFKEYIGKLV